MKQKNIETEFLPAALELEETPASPAGRLMIWTIVLLFTSGIAWASMGQLDIVTVATGKIIASGHSKQIQAMDIGTVKAIHVQEGQAVRKGDVLIELDDRSARADEQRLSNEKQLLQKEIERLDSLLDMVNGSIDSADETGHLDQLGHAQWQEYSDSRQSLISIREKLEVEQKSLQTQVEKYRKLLPIVSKKADNFKKLSNRKLLAEQQYLEAEQQRIEVVHELKTLYARSEENMAGVKEAEDRLQQYISEFKRSLLQRQDETQHRIQVIQQELVKADRRIKLQTLLAPVDGVVQQLVMHTVGGVVSPAQVLMIVVPQQANLEVEAFVENRDIGFVEAGQQVEVKIEAFPFTRYGVIRGEITHLSRDAIADEHKGLIYKAQIALHDNQVMVNGRAVALSPGMNVTAETKTGKRRMIEYFLSPLLRAKNESLRER